MAKALEYIRFFDFKKIIDNLHDEIMVFDDNYRLVYLNNASIRHYGLLPEEMIGKKFHSLDEVYWGNSTLPDVYKTKQTVAKRQITNLGQDVITISTPIFDENNDLKFVAQNVNDLYYREIFNFFYYKSRSTVFFVGRPRLRLVF